MAGRIVDNSPEITAAFRATLPVDAVIPIARWPADVSVPLARRAVPTNAPEGLQEGDLCLRTDGRGQICRGRIEYLPDRSDEHGGGCYCHVSPPCGFCTSTMPECPACGWREGE